MTRLAFHPNNLELASASKDKTVRIWNVQTGTLIRQLTDHTHLVYDVHYKPDGKALATLADDHKLMIWDAQGTRLHNIALNDHPTRLRYSPNNHWLAVSYESGLIELRDTQAYKIQHTLHVEPSIIYGLSWSPDSTTLATTNANAWTHLFQCR